MTFSRLGDNLWQEWTGDGYEPSDPDAVVYYIMDFIEPSNEYAERALVSRIQRDGVVDSVRDGFNLLESMEHSHGYVTTPTGERDMVVCELDGSTAFGESVEAVLPITWVEVYPK